VPIERLPEQAPSPSARTRNDWMLALTFITITLVVTVLLYVSRF
jgi:nitrate reductase NapE component